MLCSTGDMFVKAIETVPALAVNDVVLNFRAAPGPAATLSACPAPVAPLAGAVVAELEVVGAGAALDGVEAEELVLLEELPQPASTITPSASTGIEDLARKHAFAWIACWNLTR
jgi:hypothetical protein